MKKYLLIYILSLVSIFIFVGTVKAESNIYSSQTGHYSFTIPNGWIKTSQYEIAQKIKYALEHGGTAFPTNYAGFQVSGTSTFPSMTIYEFLSDNASYLQMQQEFNNKLNPTLNLINGTYPDANATSGIPYIDKNRNMVFVKMQANVPGIGPADALMVYILGKDVDVSLSFYSLDSDYSKDLLIFNAVVNSFKFEKGYEYVQTTANTGSINYSVWITPAVLVLFGIWQSFRWNSKKTAKKFLQ